jgi:hypothetical protein
MSRTAGEGATLETCRCAAIDWAKDIHDVVVQNADGQEVWAAPICHSEIRIDRLCDRLIDLEVRRVAIERPDGLLVERLLDVVPDHVVPV